MTSHGLFSFALIQAIGLAAIAASRDATETSPTAAPRRQDEERLLNELLARDREYASKLRTALESRELLATTLRETLDLESEARDDVDLGFGARLSQARGRAGTGSLHVRIVVADDGPCDWVVEAQVAFGSGMVVEGVHARDAFKDTVRAIFSTPVDERESGFAFDWRDDVRRNALMDRLRDALEGPTVVEPSDASNGLRQAVQLLSSPLRADASVFGVECGFVSTKLAERQAIEEIVAAGRWDLVRGILRSLNPEGRTYAAQALIESDQASPADSRAIRRLCSSDLPIRICGGGCVIERSTMANVLFPSGAPRAR